MTYNIRENNLFYEDIDLGDLFEILVGLPIPKHSDCVIDTKTGTIKCNKCGAEAPFNKLCPMPIPVMNCYIWQFAKKHEECEHDNN